MSQEKKGTTTSQNQSKCRYVVGHKNFHCRVWKSSFSDDLILTMHILFIVSLRRKLVTFFKVQHYIHYLVSMFLFFTN